ncbi:chemotaxis protein CheW [Nitrospirota bacterium]
MATDAIEQATQYLSFNLSDELFALDISKVREVIEFASITKVPQTPDFMRGVINLRGGVVPVVDLKQKFGMGETEKTINTCVIISEVRIDGDTIVLGAMADAVDEVFDLLPENIEPSPRIGTQLNTEFLKGMGKKDDEFILLLDIDRVFSMDELDLVQQVGKQADTNEETEGSLAQ